MQIRRLDVAGVPWVLAVGCGTTRTIEASDFAVHTVLEG